MKIQKCKGTTWDEDSVVHSSLLAGISEGKLRMHQGVCEINQEQIGLRCDP